MFYDSCVRFALPAWCDRKLHRLFHTAYAVSLCWEAPPVSPSQAVSFWYTAILARKPSTPAVSAGTLFLRSCNSTAGYCLGPSVFRRHGQSVLTQRSVAIPHDLVQQLQGPFPFTAPGWAPCTCSAGVGRPFHTILSASR